MECGSDPTKREEGARTDCSHTVVASGRGGGCVVDHDVCACMDTVVNGTWQLAVHSRTISGLACYN